MDTGATSDAARISDANWEADGSPSQPPAAPDPRRKLRGYARRAASTAVVVALAAGAWVGSGKLFAAETEQKLADRWSELQVCLLGPGRSGRAAAEQIRRIALTADGDPQAADWPARCLPYAQAFDTVANTPAGQKKLGELPSATLIVQADHIAAHGNDVDVLQRAIDAAELPVARTRRTVVQAPKPAKTTLRASELAVLGRVADLTTVEASLDADRGRLLRLLLPEEQPLVCSFNDGAQGKRWRSAACRSTTLSLPADSRLRLAASEPTAADVIIAQQPDEHAGLYDGSTGQPLWKAATATPQAVVTKAGTSYVLDRAIRKNKSKPAGWRLVWLDPGKRPRSRHLKMRPSTQPLLLPDALLWWTTDERDGLKVDHIYGLPIKRIAHKRKSRLRNARLGRLPAESQYVAGCHGSYGHAMLAASSSSPARYSLLFHRGVSEAKVVDAGVIAGKVRLQCREDSVALQRLDERNTPAHVSAWECHQQGCKSLGKRAIQALGSLHVWSIQGDRLLELTADPGGALRMRRSSLAEGAASPWSVLMDDPEHGGLEIQAMRLHVTDGIGLVLLQQADGQLLGLRVSRGGEVTAVRVAR